MAQVWSGRSRRNQLPIVSSRLSVAGCECCPPQLFARVGFSFLSGKNQQDPPLSLTPAPPVIRR